MANGEHLASNKVCRGLEINISCEAFRVDCYTLHWSEFDLMLEVRWIETLGPIVWDFGRLTMPIWCAYHTMCWQGQVAKGAMVRASAADDGDFMAALLEEYAELFAKPSGLSPARRYNHRIHPIAGTDAVGILLYRNPQLQKDKLECQCKEMM